MWLKFHLLTPLLLLIVGHAYAQENKSQTVDYSIIRSAGALCGAGLSVDAKGEIDASISRIFGGGVEATGETRLDLGQVESLLEQVSENESKNELYKTYVTCVTQTINAIVGVSAESDIEPVIDSLLIPDPLIVIKHNQKFAMRKGETRAIGKNTLIFSLDSVSAGNKRISGSFTDLDSGTSKSTGRVNQAGSIEFYKGCTVVPYLITEEKVSFQSKCK